MLTRPGILLDRDGVVIEDYHYVGHPERVQLIPGAAQAIASFNQAGIPVAIITNQGGVARGFYPERNVHLVHEYILRELALHGARIDLFLYSPHDPRSFMPRYRQNKFDHKPRPGMAIRASRALRLDLADSIVVGDRTTDIELARSIGADCVYLGKPTDYSQGNRWLHCYPSLAAAASFIIERITGMDNSHFPVHGYGNIAEYFSDYTSYIYEALNSINPLSLRQAASALSLAYQNDQRIFVAGNGGAAALADHFACDHTKGIRTDTNVFSNVISLTSNTALLTAIANDIGYDAVFSYQLEQHRCVCDDVLVAFSASGNSANIVRAVQCAIENNMHVIGVTGFDGGKVRSLVNFSLHINSHNYGIVEDVMQMLSHVIAQFIRQSDMSNAAIKSARF